MAQSAKRQEGYSQVLVLKTQNLTLLSLLFARCLPPCGRSLRLAPCALRLAASRLRLKLFAGLAQPKADPSSGGLWRSLGRQPRGGYAPQDAKNFLGHFKRMAAEMIWKSQRKLFLNLDDDLCFHCSIGAEGDYSKCRSSMFTPFPPQLYQ